jgi:pSer/pThr/pTyr-binding forkhead associated (FHA) protein
MVVKLIVASGKSAGRSISLKNGRLLIGRAEDCDVRPLGEAVSRRHCAVIAEGGGVTVEDLKSRNGTYVNGVRIATKITVADGDIVRVGPLELKVSCVVPAAAPVVDDVSRWLMADDEPAGMFDTTQTIVTADVASPATADASSSGVVPVGAETAGSGGDSALSVTMVTSGIDALVAARGQPAATLPPEARGPKTVNSKDAAADALRKFFGKR